MDIKSFAQENFVRFLALVCLIIGLSDAARVTGVSSGSVNPLDILGVTGFVLLAIFALARLFAAVGLWIHSSWGGVMLAGTTIVELGLVISGSPNIHISLMGLIIRLALAAGIVSLFVVEYLSSREHIHN